MQLESPRTPNARRHERSAAASLALQAVSSVTSGSDGSDFVVLRLDEETRALSATRERSALRSLCCLLREGEDDPPALGAALLAYVGALEQEGRLAEAAEVLEQVALLVPDGDEIALHAARIERKRGNHERARSLYRSARERSGGEGRLARMAAVGEAMLAPEPTRALGRALRRAVRTGDEESAAVAQEERARARRRSGDRPGALRDYLVAAARFPDPVDGARVLHEAADMLSAGGDLLAVRELLLVALELGRSEQRSHALARLHAVSRAVGDEVGRRRWAGSGAAPLVSLVPARAADPAASRAGRLHRNLRRLRLGD